MIAAATEPLQGALADLFAQPVAVGVADPRQDYGPLPPEEWAAIRRASPARAREFAAGRMAARAALAALGRFGEPVASGRDRAPRWPSGLVGSIAHSRSHGIAAVAEEGRLAALGIDIEPDSPLPPDLAPLICDRAESAWLQAQPAEERGRWARLIFSAKEAAYKCQYPLSRTMLGFEAFRITFLPGARFAAEFCRQARRFRPGDVLEGRFAFCQGQMITAVALEG